jgi:Domain of unknown function (DUF4263)
MLNSAGGGNQALDTLQFDSRACVAELEEFATLLAAKAEVSEREDILPFFRTHRQLAAFTGSFHPNIVSYDRLGSEVPLFGAFVPDLIVGDWERRAYWLVEFEDGRHNSIFSRRARQTTGWSPRFEQGFSQIIDWLWLLDDQRHTDLFERLFNTRAPDILTLLVLGRDSSVTASDWSRLVWRRNHVVANSRHIYCCTFDELVRSLRSRLRAYSLLPSPS